MNIQDFVSRFTNHPVMFVGSGLSLRYLQSSYNWDSLLTKIALELNNDIEYYLDIKSDSMVDGVCQFEKVASKLEEDFNSILKKSRHGKFEKINDVFYKRMAENINISRFKLYIASLLQDITLKNDMLDEIAELKKARKNIGSIITTNYDQLIEQVFEFNPLIGNDILLSNPYGSVYKIHGCVTMPEKIIITENDYKLFDQKYELIRAQLLSLFIHNPILFIGYNIGDKNIKEILKTIFTYVDSNSNEARKIRDNFLLIEYERNSTSIDVSEHDIDVEGFPTIRINKIKTDNFISIYQALASIQLPVSAMDIRKVQTVVKDIYSGGEIKVKITADLDGLSNGDKVLVIGSKKTISYEFQTTSEMMVNYFKIIEESNAQLLELINKQNIQSNQYFPVFGFSRILSSIKRLDELKDQQTEKLNDIKKNAHDCCQGNHITVQSIEADASIPPSYKSQEIICSILSHTLDLDDAKVFLLGYPQKRSTDYRKILCAYDYAKYYN